MFAFLFDPTVITVAATIFGIGFVVTIVLVVSSIRNRRALSTTILTITTLFILGFPIALCLSIFGGYGELKSMAYALYLMIMLGLVVTIILSTCILALILIVAHSPHVERD
jgi:hypothetical protein